MSVFYDCSLKPCKLEVNIMDIICIDMAILFEMIDILVYMTGFLPATK